LKDAKILRGLRTSRCRKGLENLLNILVNTAIKATAKLKEKIIKRKFFTYNSRVLACKGWG